MEYLWLKAFHVAAVATWIGGMLMLSLAVAALPASAPANSPIFDAVARWNRFVTSPAMLLAWGLGIIMAIQESWFTETWLLIKLPIIFALSGIHGALSGRLRKRAETSVQTLPTPLKYAGEMTVVTMILVAILAVAKPF